MKRIKIDTTRRRGLNLMASDAEWGDFCMCLRLLWGKKEDKGDLMRDNFLLLRRACKNELTDYNLQTHNKK